MLWDELEHCLTHRRPSAHTCHRRPGSGFSLPSAHPSRDSLCSLNFVLVTFVFALCLFTDPLRWAKPYSTEVLAQCIGTIHRVFIAKNVCAPKSHSFHLLTLEWTLVWAGSWSLRVVCRTANFLAPLTHFCKHLGPARSGSRAGLYQAPLRRITWADAAWRPCWPFLANTGKRFS